MVSSSQLQVAKLAQMCPVAPCNAQQCPTVPNSTQQHPAAPNGTQHCTAGKNPSQNPVRSTPGQVKNRVGQNLGRSKPGQVKTRVVQNPGRSKPGQVKTQVGQNPTQGAQRRPTAPNGADQCFFKAHHPFDVLFKKRQKCLRRPDLIRPESRGPQGALGA